MPKQDHHPGGCACGRIRYTAAGAPVMVAYCHCDDCRKSCGSVVAVFAGFPKSRLSLLQGEPANFTTTPNVKRRFCAGCGTPLFYENEQFPENIYLHIGSVDNPGALPPDRHTWVSDRVPWHAISDDLTQYEQLSNAGLPDNTPPYEKRPTR